MLKKVLIAEDHESANISVQKTLLDLGIIAPEYNYYCDDAFKQVEIALSEGSPFDLLITDLYFDDDHRPQRLSGGFELIKNVKEIQPSIKILVFSAEDKVAVIDSLFSELNIDGYVRKGRNDAKELKVAIKAIAQGNKHLTANLKEQLKEKNSHEFSLFDITIISLLSKGVLQKDIPIYLQQKNIKPAGLSSVEKRLNVMKDVLNFSKNEQLVVYCKDFGII